MRKLIKRVDALETRMIPSYQPMFGGRLQNFPSPHLHHLPQHLSVGGPLYPGARVATPRQGYSQSHVEEELYQTKQWLKQRTLNLS